LAAAAAVEERRPPKEAESPAVAQKPEMAQARFQSQDQPWRAEFLSLVALQFSFEREERGRELVHLPARPGQPQLKLIGQRKQALHAPHDFLFRDR